MRFSFSPEVRRRRGVAQSALLAAFAVVVLAGITMASVVQLLNLKQQLADKHSALLALTSQNEGLREQLDSLEASRRSAEERLTALKNQLLSKTTEVDQLRRAMSDLQAKYDVFEFEKNRLTEAVGQLTQERDDAAGRLVGLEAEKRDLEQAAARFRERFALLDRDYQQVAARLAEAEQGSGSGGIQASVRARMDPAASASARMGLAPRGEAFGMARPTNPSSVKVTVSGVTPESVKFPGAGPSSVAMAQTIELPPIVVRKEDAAGIRAIRARVVEVNRLNQFVIIDRGARDGVLTGMTFDLQRGGVKVAQVTAIRVRPQLTACEIAPAPGAPFPQVGDVAVQRAP